MMMKEQHEKEQKTNERFVSERDENKWKREKEKEWN